MPLKTIDGKPARLADFEGEALLIVNVASQCGFTPQYAGLEELHRRFRDRGFAVLGFPCDQFGHQEPGDESAIKKFCTDNYDVSFPMFAKTEVNGSNAHPLFKALKQAAPVGRIVLCRAGANCTSELFCAGCYVGHGRRPSHLQQLSESVSDSGAAAIDTRCICLACLYGRGLGDRLRAERMELFLPALSVTFGRCSPSG